MVNISVCSTMFRSRCFKCSFYRDLLLKWIVSHFSSIVGDKVTILPVSGDTEADEAAKERDDVSKEREPLLWSGDVLRLTQVSDVN